MAFPMTRTPAQIEDLHDWAVNASPLMNGRADAIAHFGKLTRGELAAGELADIQADLLETSEPGYPKGYSEAWNVLCGLISGVATEDLHRL